jgi:Predicted secreted protein
MPIGPLTMIAIYLVCWWTVLFAVLPLGMNQRDQERPTDGGQWGAPSDPKLKQKFITTTWVSAIVWLVIMVVIWTGIMPLPDFDTFSRNAPNL